MWQDCEFVRFIDNAGVGQADHGRRHKISGLTRPVRVLAGGWTRRGRLANESDFLPQRTLRAGHSLIEATRLRAVNTSRAWLAFNRPVWGTESIADSKYSCGAPM
ncbi:hypothetical protein SBA3_2230024 [Candidatus Sulfopaludibacter sp. SbA3]|nr:hypothetical protein SBA3_2230024 [Candidatus Sulfopaludibacter sp. SbA3]